MNNLQVLPFYDSLEKQNHRKPYAFGQAYPLIASTKSILPFQLEIESFNGSSDDISEASIVYLDTQERIQILQEFRAGAVILAIDNSKDIVTWPAPVLFTQLRSGLAYIIIKDYYDTEYYSEVFCLTDDLRRYIKLDWWDSDSDDNPGFIHTVYIDSMVGKPEYEFEEEGTDRDGYFFAEKQLSKKVYKFSFVAPEYLCDAMRIVRMADNIQVIFNSAAYNCDSFEIEVDWEEQGDLAGVDVEFTVGTVIKKTAAGYNWPLTSGGATDTPGSNGLIARINALETTVVALDGNVKALSSLANTAQGLAAKVTKLETTVVALDGNVKALSSLANTAQDLTAKVTKLETTVAAHDSSLEGLAAKVTKLETTVAAHDSSLEALSGLSEAITELNNKMNQITEEI